MTVVTPVLLMKILHTADIHIDHEWFDWIATNCIHYDLLVIAGDLQDAFSSTRMHRQVDAIQKWLLAIRTPTIVCSGNHDYWAAERGVIDPAAEGRWLSSLKEQGKIVATDGDIIRYQGLLIEVNGWLKKPIGCRDILVTHAPPTGCSCAESAGNDFGDPELWNAMQAKPRLILSGHVHRPKALWSRFSATDCLVLVPGHDEQSPIPQHWVIDTKRASATHNTGIEISL